MAKVMYQLMKEGGHTYFKDPKSLEADMKVLVILMQ